MIKGTQLISESYNNSHKRVKITPQGGVTIFGVNITPKRSYFNSKMELNVTPYRSYILAGVEITLYTGLI